MYPAQFHGHGFLIKDYIRDYTKLREGLLCPLLSVEELGLRLTLRHTERRQILFPLTNPIQPYFIVDNYM